MLKVQIHKTFHSSFVPFELKFDFSLKLRQIVCLNGKSGSGKTSLLRMLAGIETPDLGLIQFDNSVWFSSEKKIKKEFRKIGFVFQESTLFPHMTVLENLKFVQGKDSILSIEELIIQFKLSDLLEHKPTQISGGQAQRVSLACTIAQEPDLLLLDEPFSALDQQTRNETQQAFLYFQQKLQLTTLIVSHHVEETLEFANEELYIEKGCVINSDSVIEV